MQSSKQLGELTEPQRHLNHTGTTSVFLPDFVCFPHYDAVLHPDMKVWRDGRGIALAIYVPRLLGSQWGSIRLPWFSSTLVGCLWSQREGCGSSVRVSITTQEISFCGSSFIKSSVWQPCAVSTTWTGMVARQSALWVLWSGFLPDTFPHLALGESYIESMGRAVTIIALNTWPRTSDGSCTTKDSFPQC